MSEETGGSITLMFGSWVTNRKVAIKFQQRNPEATINMITAIDGFRQAAK